MKYKILLVMLILLMFVSVISAKIYLGALEVYFSPGSVDSVVKSKIDKAEESICLAIFSFTDTTIANCLIRAKKRDVDIKVIMDKQQAASKYAIDEKLEEAGIEVIIDNESKYMHDKYMVIDRDLVMTGSYNYTNNAKRNRENMIVIYDSEIAKDFYDNFFEMYHKMKPD